MISWWGWSDANRARASPALMVATPRHDVVVAIPVAAADAERKGEEPRVRVDRAPRVDANRNCCRVGLDVAGSASLRRKTAAAATMVMKILILSSHSRSRSLSLSYGRVGRAVILTPTKV